MLPLSPIHLQTIDSRPMSSIDNQCPILVKSFESFDNQTRDYADRMASLFVDNCPEMTNEQWTSLTHVGTVEEFSKLAFKYINPGFFTKFSLVKTINHLSTVLLKEERRILNAILIQVGNKLSYNNWHLLNPLEQWAAKHILRQSKEESDSRLAQQIDSLAKSPKAWTKFRTEIREFLLESLKNLPNSAEQFPNFQGVIDVINDFFPTEKIVAVLKNINENQSENLLAKFSLSKLLKIAEYDIPEKSFKQILNLINKILSVSPTLVEEKNQIAEKILSTSIPLSRKFLFLEICNPRVLQAPDANLHALFFKLFLENSAYALKLLEDPRFSYFKEPFYYKLKNEIAKKILSKNHSPTQIFQQLELLDPPLLQSPEKSLRDLFFKLFLENSPYALRLLQDSKFSAFKYYFDVDFLNHVQIRMMNEDQPNRLTLFKNSDEQTIALNHFTLLDFPDSSEFLCKKIIGTLKTKEQRRKFAEQLLENLCIFDNAVVFQKLYDLLSLHSEYPLEKMIEQAVKNKAPKCLFYLFSNHSVSKGLKERIAKETSPQGYAEIVLAVCKNDADEANHFLFSEFLNPIKRSQCEERLLRMMRFTPLNLVDTLIESLLKKALPDDREGLLTAVKSAKAQFHEVASFISRYRRPFELKIHKDSYRSSLKDDDTVKADLAYAQSCRKNISELLNQLHSSNFSPSTQEFCQLPKSAKGTSRAAALLERISELRYLKQVERSDITLKHGGKLKGILPPDENFKTLRTNGWATPHDGLYTWAIPLLNSVLSYSKAPDLEKFLDKEMTGSWEDPKQTFQYKLKYKDKVLTEVEPVAKRPGWRHGKQPISETWQAIEDIFEELMAFDLSTKKTPQNPFAKFYDLTAELVWLIGNTQPLKRGSGTFAEWMLGIVHLKHGMNPPILKTDFPQLDVLNITFPLSDYKRLFTHFFEQSTLAETMRRPDSNEPLLKQMEKYYKLW